MGFAQEWDKYRRFIDWAAEPITFLPVFNAGMDRLEKIMAKKPTAWIWFGVMPG